MEEAKDKIRDLKTKVNSSGPTVDKSQDSESVKDFREDIIERLKSTMANMAQMHDAKVEKMAQEADAQVTRLRDEIAKVSSELESI